MHTRRLLSFKEPHVETILRKRLEKDGYRIHAKVRLSDAIVKDKSEYLEDREFDYLTRAHLDFLITKNNLPRFAVEFDERHHLEDETTIERDTVKNRLCRSAGLPLLRIGADELTSHDKTTILDYMLDRYVSWPKEKDELLRLIEEYAADAPEHASPEDLDPHFYFDLQHPFPGIAKIENRLWRNHRIASENRPPARQKEAQYLCLAHLRSKGPSEHDQYTTCESVAVVWEAGRSQHDSLFSASAVASVRAWLPTELDIPQPQPPDLGTLSTASLTKLVDQLTKRVNAMWFPDLPGIEPWDIAENLSEYLALREVEKWAKKYLGT